MTTVEGYRALVVPVDGAVRQVVLATGDDYGLDALRVHIGCEYVEHVRGPGCSLWVDEEGAVVAPPRPANPRIDALLRRPDGWSIRGDVVITGAVRSTGDACSLAPAQVEDLLTAMGAQQ